MKTKSLQSLSSIVFLSGALAVNSQAAAICYSLTDGSVLPTLSPLFSAANASASDLEQIDPPNKADFINDQIEDLITNGPEDDDVFQFVVKIPTPTQVTLTSISFKAGWQGSDPDTTNLLWGYKLTVNSPENTGPLSYENNATETTGFGGQLFTFDLDGLIDLTQDVIFTITLRTGTEIDSLGKYKGWGDRNDERYGILDEICLEGTAIVPEPSTALVAGLGGLMLLIRRRRA